ncbi:putative PD-(D/E)XK family protein DUF4420 [Luteibacter rhizovicinus]|uniref:Putative PD-(D/E)XK family protein DUF4420 n=1 Tax=Luteibacter rhizovicinus TaxID=242606 RepID=A0A4R3YHH4_9GAMM|nr:PD-(D/E)XK motif protein [Luteibacter rhizovicinus]TCV91620.1 putative PD-(D/E)XK family protein DUF4420 [Luteibacter rhizovicinus]
MTTPLNDPWAGLQSSTNWVGRRLNQPHPLDLFWAVHPSGAIGLVTKGMTRATLPGRLPQLRGISVEIEPGSDAGYSLHIFLRQEEDRDLFLRLCNDIIEISSMATTESEATRQLFGRLKRWQRLLGLSIGSLLSDREVRGLIGELWLLRKNLIPRLGLPGALRSWVAPDCHPQDFASTQSVIEMKVRLTGSRNQVSISSLNQLDSPILPLRLIVAELSPSQHIDALSLNELAQDLLEDAEKDGDEILAESLLCRRGYVHSSTYDSLTYEVTGQIAFEVRGHFPRIARSNVDHRIIDATYSLSLENLEEFRSDFDTTISMFCMQQ